MAKVKISDLTPLGAAPASDDLIPVVDVDDLTQAASGTTKRVTVGELGATEAAARVTGDTTRVANAQTVNYTLVLADAGKVVEINSATAKTVTVPTNATQAFPVGTIVEVQQIGAGLVTVAPAGGVTLIGAHLVTDGIGGSLFLRKQATNTWVIKPSQSGTFVQIGGAPAGPVEFVTQQATDLDPTGGLVNGAMVIVQQITTWGHDLMLFPGPVAGDIHLTRPVGGTGALFIDMPVKYRVDGVFTDGANAELLRLTTTGALAKFAADLVGNQGANKNLRIVNGGASGVIRFLASNGATSLVLISEAGDVTLGAGGLVLPNTKALTLTMAAGANGQVASDASNRLNLAGGTGGGRVLNAAFSTVLFSWADTGAVTFAFDVNLTSGKYLTLGGTAAMNVASNRLDIQGPSTSIRFLNSAFNAVNLEIKDNGDHLLRRGGAFWGHAAVAAQPAAIASPSSDTVGTKAAIDAILAVLSGSGQTA